jgi:acetyl esterase/lipase
MQTPRVLGRIKQRAGLRPRSRSSTSYLPQGTACLEERFLLSGTTPSALHQTVEVRTAYTQGPTGVPSILRAQPDQIVYRNITYTDADGRPEQLDVYVPKGPPPTGGWPVILAIHGGGWRKQDKGDYGPRIASAFVPNGYVVVAPNYPLSSPGNATWPINLEDLQSAVRWIRQSAGTFNIDPGRIVAMGESAGANLANLLGTASGAAGTTGPAASSAVEAVVSFSSPTDLPALYAASPLAGYAAAQMLGGPPSAVPGNYIAASPVDQVRPGDPPTFLVHGGNDPLVPVSQSYELAAVLTKMGVPNQLVVIPGAGHDLDFPDKTPRNLILQILEFLEATWNYK